MQQILKIWVWNKLYASHKSKQNEIREWEQRFWRHVQSFQWFKVRLWSSPFEKAILKSYTFKDYSNSLKQWWNATDLLPLIEEFACNNVEQSSDLDLFWKNFMKSIVCHDSWLLIDIFYFNLLIMAKCSIDINQLC